VAVIIVTVIVAVVTNATAIGCGPEDNRGPLNTNYGDGHNGEHSV
jgi:hypothetical protein